MKLNWNSHQEEGISNRWNKSGPFVRASRTPLDSKYFLKASFFASFSWAFTKKYNHKIRIGRNNHSHCKEKIKKKLKKKIIYLFVPHHDLLLCIAWLCFLCSWYLFPILGGIWAYSFAATERDQQLSFGCLWYFSLLHQWVQHQQLHSFDV